jgi:predicted Zn-dependent protease
MRELELLPIGNFDERLLREVAPALADAFRVPCRILPKRLDPHFAFHRERQQFHSSELLAAMQEYAGEERVERTLPATALGACLSTPSCRNDDKVSGRPDGHALSAAEATARAARPWRVLGVTGVDLYIPILTFVFGEAQMGGPCAIVSFHRLMQEFYGLDADPSLLAARLIKEAVHEVGHTLDLTHCDDYTCAMAPSHAVEWIDLKESTLCQNCQERALAAVG